VTGRLQLTATSTVLLGVPRSRVAIAFGAYLGVVLIAVLLNTAPAARAAFVSLAYVAFAGAALYFNLRRVAAHDPSARAWRWISAAGVVAIVFELLLTAEALAPASVHIPDAAWLGQTIASNSAISLGVLLLPYGTQRGHHRLRMACDAFAFALAAFLAFWVIGARNEVHDSTASLITRTEAVVSYAFNALELGIVVYIGSRSANRFRGPLGWFLLAFAVMTVGTGIVLFSRVRGVPTVGGVGELVQLIAFPCFVLAPMSIMPNRWDWVDEASLGGDLLTYAPILLSMLIVLPASFGSRAGDIVLDFGVPLLAATLLFRQFLAVRDVRELSRTLEQRVAERTDALRRSEVALMQAQRHEAVGRVAGSVAHDFNNVLHAIQLAAGTLDEAPELAAWREELEIIRNATRSGAALAREVLEFSKPEVPDGDQADVAETLRSLEWMRHQLTQRRISYDVRLPPEGTNVRLGATRLEQVLSNLIANARDAVADGGCISVSAEPAWVADGLPSTELGVISGSYVRLSVVDDGTGISAEVLPRLFEPYFTTKAEAQGTGLGLATCYNVVRSAGGTVTVTSKPGGGSRFDVLLPLSE
jgi:signal transduction histidine kinase